jgi:hypothetical protein
MAIDLFILRATDPAPETTRPFVSGRKTPLAGHEGPPFAE